MRGEQTLQINTIKDTTESLSRMSMLRDRPKFTGYPGWVLGNLTFEKKTTSPSISQTKKIFARTLSTSKKSWPPYLNLEKVGPIVKASKKTSCPPPLLLFFFIYTWRGLARLALIHVGTPRIPSALPPEDLLGTWHHIHLTFSTERYMGLLVQQPDNCPLHGIGMYSHSHDVA